MALPNLINRLYVTRRRRRRRERITKYRKAYCNSCNGNDLKRTDRISNSYSTHLPADHTFDHTPPGLASATAIVQVRGHSDQAHSISKQRLSSLFSAFFRPQVSEEGGPPLPAPGRKGDAKKWVYTQARSPRNSTQLAARTEAPARETGRGTSSSTRSSSRSSSRCSGAEEGAHVLGGVQGCPVERDVKSEDAPKQLQIPCAHRAVRLSLPGHVR